MAAPLLCVEEWTATPLEDPQNSSSLPLGALPPLGALLPLGAVRVPLATCSLSSICQRDISESTCVD